MPLKLGDSGEELTITGGQTDTLADDTPRDLSHLSLGDAGNPADSGRRPADAEPPPIAPHFELGPTAEPTHLAETPPAAPPEETNETAGSGLRLGESLDAEPQPAPAPPAETVPRTATELALSEARSDPMPSDPAAPTPAAEPEAPRSRPEMALPDMAPPEKASANTVPPEPAHTPEDGDPGGGDETPDGGKGGKPPARLGDKLIDMGLISKDQLSIALQEKRRSSKMMGELLVELGFITEQALGAVLAESSGFERFHPGADMVDPEVFKYLPKEVATRYRVFPVAFDGTKVRMAMADIYDVLTIDQVERYFPAGTEIVPLVAQESDILTAIDQYYGHELSIDGILRELERLQAGEEIDDTLDDITGSQAHPLIRLVNAILLDAVKVKASDLHFEPEGNFLRVRYRIDGVMSQIRTIHKQHWPAFSHRIKIMAGMNIADKLNPQDGRFSMHVGSRRIDFRVSSLPTVHGENIVLRVLDKSSTQVEISTLGFSDHNFSLIRRMITRPEGIIIVTGPTGSGKTTTLYAIMNHINSIDRNIMTLEDPVEYELSLIRQTQIREGTQLNFSDGIRSLMRQDPDVILVGEVRDSDTASMALRAAMTGHQVYTTLHTNDAIGVIPRLMDMGMRPALMAGNIIGIIAQRLARKLCSVCKEMKPATPEDCQLLGADPANPPVIGYAKGCVKCRNTGYLGRVALAEIMPMNAELDEMIITNQPLFEIRRASMNFGFVPMADDGVDKVLQGVISVDSLMRVVDLTSRM